jgi:hypothetical protein
MSNRYCGINVESSEILRTRTRTTKLLAVLITWTPIRGKKAMKKIITALCPWERLDKLPNLMWKAGEK